MLALSGPVFFALAYRLSAYQGVMAARAAEQEAGDAPASPEAHQRPAQAPVQRVSEADLLRDPEFPGIFSFSNASDHRPS